MPIVWDGDVGDGLMNIPANWVGDISPDIFGSAASGNDFAVIDNGDNVTYTGSLNIANSSDSNGGLTLVSGSSITTTGEMALGTSGFAGNTTGATGTIDIGPGCSLSAGVLLWVSIESGNNFTINLDGAGASFYPGSNSDPIRTWDTGWQTTISSWQDLWNRGILTHNEGQNGTFADNFNVLTDGTLVSKGVIDTIAPAAPTGLTATPGDATVSLNWDDNTESDLYGYKVYRSTGESGPFHQAGSIARLSYYEDRDVVDGMVYFYRVTAVDSSSNESGYSNQAYANLRRKGDLTGGGTVDLFDLALFATNWLDTDCGYCNGADLSGDEKVNLDDMLVLAEYWLTE